MSSQTIHNPRSSMRTAVLDADSSLCPSPPFSHVDATQGAHQCVVYRQHKQPSNAIPSYPHFNNARSIIHRNTNRLLSTVSTYLRRTATNTSSRHRRRDRGRSSLFSPNNPVRRAALSPRIRGASKPQSCGFEDVHAVCTCDPLSAAHRCWRTRSPSIPPPTSRPHSPPTFPTPPQALFMSIARLCRTDQNSIDRRGYTLRKHRKCECCAKYATPHDPSDSA